MLLLPSIPRKTSFPLLPTSPKNSNANLSPRRAAGIIWRSVQSPCPQKTSRGLSVNFRKRPVHTRHESHTHTRLLRCLNATKKCRLFSVFTRCFSNSRWLKVSDGRFLFLLQTYINRLALVSSEAHVHHSKVKQKINKIILAKLHLWIISLKHSYFFKFCVILLHRALSYLERPPPHPTQRNNSLGGPIWSFFIW